MTTEDSFKDETEYSSIFELFSRGRLEQERFWVANKFVPKLTEKFKPRPGRSDLDILAVGSGIGSFDVMLLEELLRAEDLVRNRKIRCTVVEPLSSAIQRFKSTVDKRAKDFRNIEFVWVNKNIGEYADELILNGAKFDLIHFIHVLYYLDETKVLEMAYKELLKKPGVILSVVGSAGDIWVKLIESYKDKIDSLTKQLHYPTNVKIFQNIKENGWDVELFDGKLDLEITEMLTVGHPDGTAMLKFFLHTSEDPQKVVGQELYTELIEFFKSQSWEDTSNDTTKYFVNDDEGVMLIFK